MSPVGHLVFKTIGAHFHVSGRFDSCLFRHSNRYRALHIFVLKTD